MERFSRLFAGIAVISSLFTAPLAAAPQEILRIDAAARGQIIDAAGTPDQAEVLRFGGSVASQLSVTAPESSLRIAGWPVAPGQRADVVLTRHEVYAPDAKVWKVEGDRRTEVPRSSLAFFWGTAEDDPDVRVFVSVDPDTDQLDGFALSEHATHEIHPLSSVKLDAAAPADRQYLVAPPEVFLEQAGEDPSWTCGQNGAPMDFLLGNQATGIPAGGSGLPASLTAAAITSLHTARLIIDTDTELLSIKFGNNTTTAGNYVASLIAQMNVIYQRDLLIQLVQGDTFLRVGTDPWNQPSTGGASSSQLQEVTTYWSTAPNSAIPRAFVAMLSGKGGSGASGIAWVPSGLCGTGSSVSFSQVFTGGTSPSFGDVLVVAHEIGHNFGSPHTHCYNPPLDTCRSGEGSGCYSGGQSCPTPSTINGVANVTGTLMSYCHLLGGCSSSLVFHPGSVALVAPKIQSAVGTCIFPAFTLSALNRVSGFTTGGTAVTLSGNAFAAGATVKFGGVAAVSVQVLNGNTITAVTPPHATGAVDVVVTNPGGATATKTNAFFYAPPPAASDFYTLTPCRLLDTRNAAGPLGGPALGASAQRIFTVTSTCGIPTNATAIAVNVTTVSPAALGFLAIYPGNAFPLGTSNLNFAPGKNRANNAILYLATNGTGTIGVQNNSSGALSFLIDVVGYFR
jgi:hypothetical protein